jgi:hypothetical protein
MNIAHRGPGVEDEIELDISFVPEVVIGVYAGVQVSFVDSGEMCGGFPASGVVSEGVPRDSPRAGSSLGIYGPRSGPLNSERSEMKACRCYTNNLSTGAPKVAGGMLFKVLRGRPGRKQRNQENKSKKAHGLKA